MAVYIIAGHCPHCGAPIYGPSNVEVAIGGYNDRNVNFPALASKHTCECPKMREAVFVSQRGLEKDWQGNWVPKAPQPGSSAAASP